MPWSAEPTGYARRVRSLTIRVPGEITGLFVRFPAEGDRFPGGANTMVTDDRPRERYPCRYSKRSSVPVRAAYSVV